MGEVEVDHEVAGGGGGFRHQAGNDGAGRAGGETGDKLRERRGRGRR